MLEDAKFGEPLVKWRYPATTIRVLLHRVLLPQFGRLAGYAIIIGAVVGFGTFECLRSSDLAAAIQAVRLLAIATIGIVVWLVVVIPCMAVTPLLLTIYSIRPDGLFILGNRKESLFRWSDVESWELADQPLVPGVRLLNFRIKGRAAEHTWPFSSAGVNEETIRVVMGSNVVLNANRVEENGIDSGVASAGGGGDETVAASALAPIELLAWRMPEGVMKQRNDAAHKLLRVGFGLIIAEASTFVLGWLGYHAFRHEGYPTGELCQIGVATLFPGILFILIAWPELGRAAYEINVDGATRRTRAGTTRWKWGRIWDFEIRDRKNGPDDIRELRMWTYSKPRIVSFPFSPDEVDEHALRALITNHMPRQRPEQERDA